MKSFYEKNREDSHELVIQRNTPHIFPSHFHRNLEIFILRQGEFSVTLNERQRIVTSGTVVIFDSYEIHGYDARKEMQTESCVLVIPYEYSSAFMAKRQNMAIGNPVICDPALCDTLLRVVDEYLLEQDNEDIQKSAVELLLVILSQKIEWTQEKRREDTALIRSILSFIQEHYTDDASRSAISRALGYTQAHVSRVFHRYMRKGISEYVNELRLTYVEQALAHDSSKTILTLIYEAGFKSQQTYYRVKAKKQTPVYKT
ncbi:MAG: helix-turn-helix transcriptional regulator [Clostridia bacterium]|nr:helix-turn-helix transcriptional regulator [Clostridia bacterium]